MTRPNTPEDNKSLFRNVLLDLRLAGMRAVDVNLLRGGFHNYR